MSVLCYGCQLCTMSVDSSVHGDVELYELRVTGWCRRTALVVMLMSRHARAGGATMQRTGRHAGSCRCGMRGICDGQLCRSSMG